ncbi:MAG: hypothetical protein KGO52_14920, partial [Nitrospirota bacterium]|nr:hypothetical protein [Nitrospirota bacterium]
MAPRLDILRRYFDQRVVELRTSAAGQVPEEVIVFETVGSISNFIEAAKRVPGFDFMAEWDAEDIAPDNDFSDARDATKPLSGRLFLVMANQQALGQLLSLWTRFQSGRRMAPGYAPFTELFKHLTDVRRWSVKDRLLETGVDQYWREASSAHDDTLVPFEIELWFRELPQARAESVDRIRRMVTQLQGQVVSLCELAPICYHAAVASLPASQVRRLVDRQENALLGESAIMFFRPSGQSVMPSYAQSDLQAP